MKQQIFIFTVIN